MDLSLTLPKWRSLIVKEDWDTLLCHLHKMAELVKYFDGDSKQLLLQNIDELHHFLERIGGRDHQTLVVTYYNYEEVYNEIEKMEGRLSYLKDKIDYNVDSKYIIKEKADGTKEFYKVFGEEQQLLKDIGEV